MLELGITHPIEPQKTLVSFAFAVESLSIYQSINCNSCRRVPCNLTSQTKNRSQQHIFRLIFGNLIFLNILAKVRIGSLARKKSRQSSNCWSFGEKKFLVKVQIWSLARKNSRQSSNLNFGENFPKIQSPCSHAFLASVRYTMLTSFQALGAFVHPVMSPFIL